MEFKFRAVDEQASGYVPRSSGISYFTEQAIRAGFSGSALGHSTEFFRNPSENAREAVQRELEKERIREEIIAAEIARKCLLEAEVRRELMLEREMALRRINGFSLLPGPAAASAMHFDSRLSLMHRSGGGFLEERLALSLEEKLGYQAHHGIRGVETLPFQRNTEPKISEIKPPSEVSKDKIIFLAKPEGNISGAKRKAETPPVPGTSELLSAGSKKKPKEEWSCAICQVSATSEKGLEEHLRGKKHKSREAGLIAQRTGRNYAIGLFPKKLSKPNKLAEIPGNRKLEHKEKLEEKSNTGDVQQNDDLALLQVIKKNNDPKNKSGNSAKKIQKKQKKFKFWCEMCQVGAFSEKVMNNHRRGKKHVGLLQQLNQKHGPAPAAGVEGEDKKEETLDKGAEDAGPVEDHQIAEDGASADLVSPLSKVGC